MLRHSISIKIFPYFLPNFGGCMLSGGTQRREPTAFVTRTRKLIFHSFEWESNPQSIAFTVARLCFYAVVYINILFSKLLKFIRIRCFYECTTTMENYSLMFSFILSSGTQFRHFTMPRIQCATVGLSYIDSLCLLYYMWEAVG